MVKKIYIQIFLIVTLCYFLNYFSSTSIRKMLKIIKSFKKVLIDSNENVIEDLKYVSTDKDGNSTK